MRVVVWPWGQVNIRRADEVLYFSERYGLVPTIVLLGYRLTWRRWR